MKSVNCEFVLTEEQQRIKELEEVLKRKNKQLEEKDKQLYEEKSRPTTIYNTTTNNNYFDLFNSQPFLVNVLSML